ncbi:MAG: MerR family transcriptional regulator [Ferruginibacter sp.]
MRSFSINELEKYTGIKAHTIRIWERRYDLLQPERTPGNFRMYTIDQLKKILHVALLNKNGHRVSELSKIPLTGIEDKVTSLSTDQSRWQKAINELTINMFTVEPESFKWLLDELLIVWPIDVVMEKIIGPFLEVTGLFWIWKREYEEHLVITAIRKKITLGIETLPMVKSNGSSVLLFLPDSKQVDLGLLYTNYFLKRRGIRVIYMGTEVTQNHITKLLRVHQPQFIYTYLSKQTNFKKDSLVKFLNDHAPGTTLVVGAYAEDGNEAGDAMPATQALDYLVANIHRGI